MTYDSKFSSYFSFCFPTVSQLPNTDRKPIKSTTLKTRRYLTHRRPLPRQPQIFLRHRVHGNFVLPEREWPNEILILGMVQWLWAVGLGTDMVQWACGCGPVLFVFMCLIGLGSENVQFNHNILRRITIFINHFSPTFSFLRQIS